MCLFYSNIKIIVLYSYVICRQVIFKYLLLANLAQIILSFKIGDTKNSSKCLTLSPVS